VDQLAGAMRDTLDKPPAGRTLVDAVADYNQMESARQYLRLLETD
jgi:hypothetical protein